MKKQYLPLVSVCRTHGVVQRYQYGEKAVRRCPYKECGRRIERFLSLSGPPDEDMVDDPR